MCMSECMAGRRRFLLVHGFLVAAAASLTVIASGCGRDMPTGPYGAATGDVRIEAVIHRASTQTTPPTFDHARFVFRRVTGAVALDTTVAMTDGTTSAHFAIPLALDAPATGEVVTLFLSCMSSTGDIVYVGGPVLVVLSPFGTPPPVTVVLQPAGSGLPIDSLPPVAGTAVALVMSTVGSVVEAGVPLASQIVVQAVDATGALVTSFTGNISLLLGGGPSGASLVGTTTAQAVGGTAKFTGISLTKAGSGYRLLASSSPLSSATSSPFSITPSSPSSIVTAGGDGQTGVVGALLGTPLRALVSDRFGNPVPGASVAWAVAAGGGILGSATSVTDASGIASNTLHLGAVAGLNQVSATVSGVSPLLFNLTAIASTVSAAVALTMSAIGSTVQAGASLAPSIVVQAVDAGGALVSTFSGTIALLLGANPTNASLAGTTTSQASGGIARFTGINLTKAGVGYTLLATAQNLTSAASSPFAVTPAAPASIAKSGGDGQTGIVGALLGAPLKALVTDRYGNPISGATVAWAVAAGGGILGSATSVTDASGVASNTLTLGLLPGLNQVSATTAGLAPAIFQLTGALGVGIPLSDARRLSLSAATAVR
jgi:hypothetical protein